MLAGLCSGLLNSPSGNHSIQPGAMEAASALTAWCCAASVLPCLTRCQALGQKGILIFVFIHSEPELDLLILLKHAEYVEQKGHDMTYLYLFISCGSAKVNLTS